MWEKYKDIIPHIAVDSGVINTVADWVLLSGYKNVLVVCDPNTFRVAGDFVIKSLGAAGGRVAPCMFAEDEPLPNERSIGVLTAAYSPDIDLILGVGSGTINDLCTYVGAKVGCASAIVGTAPSMDGYASLGSAMLIDGVKVTPPTQCPVAIFCDVDILSAAPLLLTAAGLGDMLGKITAHADWRLAHLLVGEPMPEDIVSIVESALDKIINGAPYLPQRVPAVIKSVTEGLILSGIAMSLYGDSRPASGMEHHLAHFWEMRMLALGQAPALHGIKVGVATIIGLYLWQELGNELVGSAEQGVDFSFWSDSRANDLNESDTNEPRVSSTPKREAHTSLLIANKPKVSEIRRLYGRSSDAILQTQNPNLPISLIQDKWQEILDIAKALPSPEEIAKLLSALGAPVTPTEISISEELLRDSIVYARERKKTYTLLQLLGDLGCLEDYAGRACSYFAKNALAGVKCFVLDMDGTIYLSDKVFPFTASFLKHLEKTGKDHIFYTNNSSQNAAYYLTKLERMGIPVTPDKLMMSTHVLLEFLSDCPDIAGKRVFVSGTKALRDDFEAAGYTLADDDPDFVVLGFDMDMDYKRLSKLCDFVRSGLPYYGVHIDYNCPVESGFIPDCGSLAAAVTSSTGRTPDFFGKPSRYTLEYIIKKTGYKEEELCFVGDRLYTDIAIASGTKSRSVLVLSGETKQSDLAASKFIPDLIVRDLNELESFIVRS